MDKEEEAALVRTRERQKRLDEMLTKDPLSMSDAEIVDQAAKLDLLMADVCEELAASKQRHGDLVLMEKALRVAQQHRDSARKVGRVEKAQ